MKKMKRLLVAILGCLTALACVSGMAACKDKDSSSSSNSSSTVHTCSFEGEPEVTEATCSEAGVKTWTCTCGNTKTEAIAKAEHNLDDGIVVKAATCKETGILLISCENGCGYSKTEAIAVDETAHSWVVKSEAATCGTAGWSVEVCSACDAEKEDSYQVLEATGAHNYILDGSQSYAATCTTEGQNVYVCTTCPTSAGKGEKFIFETIEVDANNHEALVKEGVEATCGTFGYIGESCSACGYADGINLPATGNHHYVLNEEASTPATCLQDGVNVYDCTTCGKGSREIRKEEVVVGAHVWVDGSYAETCSSVGYTGLLVCEVCGETDGSKATEIPATGEHNYVVDEAMSTAATCTEAGKTVKYCTSCPKFARVLIEEEVPALGHDWTTNVVEATCGTDGYKEVICTVCFEYDYDLCETYPMTNAHNYVLIENENYVAPTCTKTGLGDFECTTCPLAARFTKYTFGVEIPALGHDYVLNTENYVEMTCSQDGFEEYDCTRCDSWYSNTISAKHTYDYNSEPVSYTAPTCLEDGIKVYNCLTCGTAAQEYITVPATGHAWETQEEVPATCTGYGTWQHDLCTACGAIANVIDNDKQMCYPVGNLFSIIAFPKGHDWVAQEAVEPACNVMGTIACEACSRCDMYRVDGEETTYEYIITGLGDHVTEEVTAATCGATGIDHCTVCDEDIVTPALDHELEFVRGVAATCGEDGYYGHYKCFNCGALEDVDGNEVTEEDIVLPAYGHKMMAGAVENCFTGRICEYCFAANEEAFDEFMKEAFAAEVVDYVMIMSWIQENLAYTPALGHNIVVVEAKDPTCAEAGNYAYAYCLDCLSVWAELPEEMMADVEMVWGEYAFNTMMGSDMTEEEFLVAIANAGAIEALAHENMTAVEAQDPDCFNAGWIAYSVCADCEAYYEVDGVATEWADIEVAATNHADAEQFGGQHATCQEDGWVNYAYCAVCDMYIVNGELVAAEDLDEAKKIAASEEYCSFDAGVILEGDEPTCEEVGTLTKTCEYCERTITEDVPALDHTWVEQEGTQATCQDAGEESHYKCSVCGKLTREVASLEEVVYVEKADLVVEASEEYCRFNDGEILEGDEPTCEEKGTLTKTCADCERTITEDVPALDHTWEQQEGTQATCQDAGEESHYKCSVCGKLTREVASLEEVVYVEKADLVVEASEEFHKFENPVQTTDPTCSAEGVMTYTCKYCPEDNKATKDEPVAIDPTAHKMVDVEETFSTCAIPGYTAHTACEYCDYTEGKVEKELDPTKHYSKAMEKGLICAEMATCDACKTKIPNTNPAEHVWEGNDCKYCFATWADAIGEGDFEMAENSTVSADEIVVVNGSLIGNGATIDTTDAAIKYNCAITTSGVEGEEITISDVTLVGAGYAIIDGKEVSSRAIGSGSSGNYKQNADLILNGVSVEGYVYSINTSGTGTQTLVAEDCYFEEWMSYSKLASAEFTNCEFASNNLYLAYIRVYDVATTFTGCTFEADANVDNNGGEWGADKTQFCLDGNAGTVITLVDCYVGETLVTAENVNELFHIYNVTVEVVNTVVAE